MYRSGGTQYLCEITLRASPKPSSPSGSSTEKREISAPWVETYDRDPNPVLTLARRIMEPLLSDVRDKVVVDIGCGTGHDLELLMSRGAKAVGLDFTSEMLHKAANKKSIRTRLVQADAMNLPLQDAAADLIVCSFVLSYVENVAQVAEQLARIALPGADVYVVDMHPEAQRHGWRAALDPSFDHMQVEIHELTRIKQAFDNAGFELQSLVEPRLGHPERRYFETVQRPDLFEQARHVPAMYLFQFRRRLLTADRNRPHLIPRKRQRTWHLVGGRHALGPHTAVPSDLVVDSSRIRSIFDRPSKAIAQRSESDGVVDLTGFLLLPGLVNPYDDLRAGWPRQTHNDVKPWLGALRNLISGVTSTLCPERLDTSEMPQFPMRLPRNFAYSAERTAEGVAGDFKDVPAEFPLLIECGWCDEASTSEFLTWLDRQQTLTARTVLLGVKYLDEVSRKLITEREAALVWAPSEGTIDKEFLQGNHSIAIATGEAGEHTITDEIQAAAKIGIAPESIYSMLTARAATILRLRNGEGRIIAETPADLLVFEDTESTPGQSLCAQVPVAVMLGGKPVLLKHDMLERWPDFLREPLRPISIGEEPWWAEEHIVAAVRGAGAAGRDLRIGGKTVRV